MKILLTGANGYIGQRLLPELVQAGHRVVCLVRDPRRFTLSEPLRPHAEILQADLLDPASLEALPEDIDAAYYLVHSMGATSRHFDDLESRCAVHFTTALARTRARQIIYLTGIVNEAHLSPHLASRLNVERILQAGPVPVTALRSAIIIGSGSASFEIIRDLVEKLPLMVAPRWLRTSCQPIAIRNVIEYLVGVLLREETFGREFDIGGTDILTYREMLLAYARVRHLRRLILIVPVLTPRLSSYWLCLVTSTTFSLAQSLVDSMTVEVICRNTGIEEIVPIRRLSYEESVRQAFSRIEKNQVASSWIDALVAGTLSRGIPTGITVPIHGCLTDRRRIEIRQPVENVVDNIWRIGGHRGWYFMNWAWQLRGLLDKLTGGVGLRRGRRHPSELRPGDALDFWRVLLADRRRGRLILYAEMRLPGEAWLEFSIEHDNGRAFLTQTATFRPSGLSGRLYWYSLLPAHAVIFRGMIRRLAGRTPRANTVVRPE